MDNELREPVVAYGKKILTEAEYLEFEEQAERKHEYFQGHVFAMAGASDAHNFIFSNVFRDISNHLRGNACYPFGSDKRIHIPENTLYTYPDISIFCNRDDTDNQPDFDKTPSVIIEILSPSTRDYDRGQKFHLYREISTLKEYVLIDSEMVIVEVHRRNSYGNWELQDYKDINAFFEIKHIKCSIRLKDVYERVQLPKSVPLRRDYFTGSPGSKE